MNISINNIINIFVIKNFKIYLLLYNNELIKLECNDELDKVNNKYIKDNINNCNINLKQCYTFDIKENNKLLISILYIDIIRYDTIKLSDNYTLVELNSLDKSNKYINKSIEYIKNKLIYYSTIKKLYSNEFVLPEIQKLYEYLFDIKIDRRNFRKKLIKLGIIEDLDKSITVGNGRPAKIYRFKELIEDKVII